MKNIYLRLSVKIIAVLAAAALLTALAPPSVKAELNLTPEEKEYAAGAKVLKAVSVDGGAPIQYKDSKGNIRGIAIGVLDEVAAMTGLTFEYYLYDSAEEAEKSEADLYFGLTHHHALKGMHLSQPYLKSEMMLFINSSVDPNQLEDKIFAAIEGSSLPQGAKRKNTIFFGNREETLTAVEQGQADYGFGNAYSVAYYTLHSDYKNITTIPQQGETREYCIGLPEQNDILLSMINKSIEAIDENKVNTLTPGAASNENRKITFSMVIEAYRREIYLMITLVLLILLYSTLKNIRANKQLGLQNKRYELLSHISNECLFEYHVRAGHLSLSENCTRIIDLELNSDEVRERLKSLLSDAGDENNTFIAKLPRAGGGEGAFRVVFSNIYDDRKKVHSVVGKLIDISDEMAEKEKLISKTLHDGLTGLYNAQATRNLITNSLNKRDGRRTDAFIIADCDNFKQINDTFGHLIGDQALANIAKSIKAAFRKTDIVGRIGGDEFCIYMQGVTADFVRAKYEQLIAHIAENSQELHTFISMGAALTNSEDTYEELFTKADKALYLAKKEGGARVVIHGEDEPGICQEE